MSGSLTVVGLGPARPEHLTVEALRLLEAAADGRYRAYGLAHAREVAHSVVPGLRVRSLDELYSLPCVSRPVAYDALARTLMRRAFEDGVDVLYLVAGSPLFLNDAVLLLRQLCAARELPLRLVHGMSFVDLILDRVYWTGHQGLQFLSTWNLVRDGMRLAPDRPALLAQLGEFTQGGEALDEAGSVASLAGLRDVLLDSLPADHPVTILYSSGPPAYRSLARTLALRDLAEAPVPVYSNLWVPAVDGPEVERRLAPPTDGHLDGRLDGEGA
jgi:tetrapyrrole methylase family protein/MazG family protein